MLPTAFFWGTGVVITAGTPLGLFLLIGGSFLTSFVIHSLIRNRVAAVALVTMILFASIAFDLFRGAEQDFNSILGNSPFIGARFYGLGNIDMTLFVTSTLILIGCLMSVRGGDCASLPLAPLPFFAVAAFFIACMILTGHPRYAANAGGFVSGAAGYGLTLALLRNVSLSKRNIAWLSLLTLLMLACLVWFVARSSTGEGHLAQLVHDIGWFGPGALLNLIERKAAAWGRSFRYLYWDLALIVASYLWWLWRRSCSEDSQCLRTAPPRLAACLNGLVCFAIVGFLLNDSGPVIPALACFLGLSTLFYMGGEVDTRSADCYHRSVNQREKTCPSIESSP
jgi:hypothetical protein